MTDSKHLFMDIHVLQTLPPSNINRDDTGSPKTASYGGARRARVSSQAWKKAMRDYFKENMKESNIGIRTYEIVRYVADKIRSLDSSVSDGDAMKQAEKAINDAGISTKSQKAKALFFLGDRQAEELAGAVLSGKTGKKELQEILKGNPAIDIALFGRMAADDPTLNEDASAQIAHAISTHAVQTEFDYYTALDDYKQENNNGAGMLGNIEFNSSTLYRYGNIALHELYRQLGNDREAMIKSVKLFIEAFCKSLPTGKVNSFANQTFPQLVSVTLRTDRPVNLVSAFETPVKSKDGYVIPSAERLDKEFLKARKFTDEVALALYVRDDDIAEAGNMGTEEASLNKLLDVLGKYLEETGLFM